MLLFFCPKNKTFFFLPFCLSSHACFHLPSFPAPCSHMEWGFLCVLLFRVSPGKFFVEGSDQQVTCTSGKWTIHWLMVLYNSILEVLGICPAIHIQTNCCQPEVLDLLGAHWGNMETVSTQLLRRLIPKLKSACFWIKLNQIGCVTMSISCWLEVLLPNKCGLVDSLCKHKWPAVENGDMVGNDCSRPVLSLLLPAKPKCRWWPGDWSRWNICIHCCVLGFNIFIKSILIFY